jgi:hypothetical protein
MAEELSSEFNYTATVVQYTILEGANISSLYPTAVIKITANAGYTVTAGDFSWNGPLAGVTSVAFTQDGEFVLCTVTYDTTSVMPAYNVDIGLCIIGDAVLAEVNIAGTLTTLVDPGTVTTTPSETNTPYSASGAEGSTSSTLFTRTYTAASGNFWPDNAGPSIQLTNGNLGQYNITQTPTYTANDELIAITYTVTYIFTDQDVSGDSFNIVIPKQVVILVPATGITAFLGDNRTVASSGTNYVMTVQGAPGATYSISMSDGTTSTAVVTNAVMGATGSAQHNFIIPSNTGTSNITWTATISGNIEAGVPTTITFDQAYPAAPCGGPLANAPVNAITDYVEPLESGGGLLTFLVKAGASTKFEIIHGEADGTKKATSGLLHPTLSNAGPFDNVTGTETSNTLPTNAQAMGGIDQYIYNPFNPAKMSTRQGDFNTDTTFDIPSMTIGGETYHQVLWWEYTAADYSAINRATLRVTNSNIPGTQAAKIYKICCPGANCTT